MSLGELALGVGHMVDYSIVVLEAIYRHRKKGRPPKEAVKEGAAEVGMAAPGGGPAGRRGGAGGEPLSLRPKAPT
ncbi:MAG: efflux RND transporter permease subunit [Bacillota bacterium]